MKSKGEIGKFVLALADQLDEYACKRLLLDMVRGPICRYCKKSIPKRHLERFYENKEVYCGACESRFFGSGGTILQQSKLTSKQILKILVMCDLGLKTKEIAKTVNISPHNVPQWRVKLTKFREKNE